MSRQDDIIRFCGLFEAELLVALMLKYWQHPSQSDPEFANDLLETAVEVLERSKTGERFIESMPPEEMNLISAVWYAEFAQVVEETLEDVKGRREWLDRVRGALPSCFCDPNDLL